MGSSTARSVFETKIQIPEAVNLLRDPRLSFSVEAGDTYDQLRGVAIGRTARIVYPDGPEYWPAAISVFRSVARLPTPGAKPAVEFAMTKRVVVIVESHVESVLGSPQADLRPTHRRLQAPGIDSRGLSCYATAINPAA